MTAIPSSRALPPLQTARVLAAEFAETAAERDLRGGTPKAERDALRARYTELNGGEKPFMGWGADKLRAEIAKLEAQA